LIVPKDNDKLQPGQLVKVVHCSGVYQRHSLSRQLNEPPSDGVVAECEYATVVAYHDRSEGDVDRRAGLWAGWQGGRLHPVCELMMVGGLATYVYVSQNIWYECPNGLRGGKFISLEALPGDECFEKTADA